MWKSSSADSGKRLGIALSVLAACGLGIVACDSLACDLDPNDNKPADYNGGTVYHPNDGGPVYESSPDYGQFLNFSEGSQIRVHHQLGSRPLDIKLWVSFSPDGTKSGDEAPPAGNMTEVECVDDDEILIRNNSCADYWLRVEASEPVGAVDGGSVPDGSCAAQ
jgi:hypothetical protein